MSVQSNLFTTSFGYSNLQVHESGIGFNRAQNSMGYNLHITRRENWSDRTPGFTLEDWLACVETDPELRHDGFAETTVGNRAVLRIEEAGLCVWTGYSGAKNGRVCWINLSRRGNIDVNNPDRETIQKMWAIAQRLGGKIQGDEGELYGPDGEPLA